MKTTINSQGQTMKQSLKRALTKTIVATMLVLGATSLLFQSAHAARSCGKASWYALTSKTASGERMNPNKMTAAHRTLPFGSIVKVTHRRTGRSVKVRINDRGPFIKGRIIDLSRAAAKRLGFHGAGVASVCISRIK